MVMWWSGVIFLLFIYIINDGSKRVKKSRKKDILNYNKKTVKSEVFIFRT